ncbi:alpha/beta fold hydrolase [Rhizobium deserti]|uniref:Alpha/beta fold hydrolase n=1 Tax=Rhizobium deserti TaxID=2547961 RepID=A0A4R5UAD1_9HYPH|nr:alpha/beta fold hydrolase [Rhizobium deserti]TDK31760.1 alpha/beta fold hydrolase [Rhizobium deserti]
MKKTALLNKKDAADIRSYQRSASTPVVFDNIIGLYHPVGSAAHAGTAALLLSPWGLEELSTRKFRRLIAEDLADKGIPSLRFDYPGTGDALDPPDFEDGLDIWERGVVAAGEYLESLGHSRLVIIGQGLGTALALGAAKRLRNVDGIALLAPVLNGRKHLRELSIWAKVVNSYTNLRDDDRLEGQYTIAGLVMPAEIAADIRKINLLEEQDLPKANWLLFNRIDPDSAKLASQLRSRGDKVEEHLFSGYQELIANPLTSQVPSDVIPVLCEWADRLKNEPTPCHDLWTSPAIMASPLAGNGFAETPIRFGDYNRLYGVLCRPTGARTSATVVFLGSAYDRHSGWGRLTTETARNLAQVGIASLRFDCANVADSPPLAGAPSQVLYDKTQNQDVSAALDYLRENGLSPAIVVGRCSGAYLAFQSALQRENELGGVVAANPFTLYWDPENPHDLVSTPQSLENYGRKIFQLQTFKRLIKGDIDLQKAAQNFATAIGRKVAAGLQARLPAQLLQPREKRLIGDYFQCMSDNAIAVDLLYSAGDVGLENLTRHFRVDGRGLKRFNNITVTVIDGADHNLTPAHARQMFQHHVIEMASKFKVGHSS